MTFGRPPFMVGWQVRLALRALPTRRRRGLTQAMGVDPAAHTSAVLHLGRAGPGDAAERHNLPVQLSSFIGREREMAEVGRLLDTVRVLTLIGSSGCGKTRLALQLGMALLDEYEDGVWFVDLAPQSDPGLVAQTVAVSLGLREEPEVRLIQTVTGHLRTRNLLLILDNCDHLVDACANLVEALLRSCPRLRILATSREALRVPGEMAWRVPPLAVPEAKTTLPFESMSKYDAVRLFIDRARLNEPALTLTPHNARAITEICGRLDGLPLAIELAAARARLMPVGQILDRLADRFQLLTDGSRTARSAHRTLRAAVDWSYDFLPDPEKVLFRRLSAFSGGFGLETAESVGADPRLENHTVLDLLAALVDKSMVATRKRSRGTARYHLLETLRQYGDERLRESGEVDTVHQRHAQYFLAFAERASTEWLGPDQVRWLEMTEEEQDNLRSALKWCLARDQEAGLRLAATMADFWLLRGYFSEGRGWLEAALKAGSDNRPRRVGALLAAGRFAYYQGDYDGAHNRYLASMTISLDLGDQEALGRTLVFIGEVATAQQDYSRGRSELEEGVAISRKCGDQRTVATGLLTLALLSVVHGEVEQARSLAEECLAICQKLGDRSTMVNAFLNLAIAAYLQKDYAAVRSLSREGLTISHELGNQLAIATWLEAFAILAAVESKPERAIRLFESAASLRQAIGAPPALAWQAGVQEALVGARTALGTRAVAAASAQGEAMTTEEAIAYALGTEDDLPESRTGQPNPLSRREEQIAVLIAAGLTNRQIARKLFIAERTAETHVDHILNKRGFHSRAQIAAWVAERGMTAAAPEHG